MKKKNENIALYMPHYGISAVVMTNRDMVKIFLDNCHDDRLYSWSQVEKQNTFDRLKQHLIKENEYFNAHPDEANWENDRWTDFCVGCVDLVTLDHYLFGNPIQLVDPDSFGKAMLDPKEAALIDGPDLIGGVPVQLKVH